MAVGQPTFMVKTYTRVYSLYSFCCWHEGEFGGFNSLLGQGVKHLLFLREGIQNRASVWYDKGGYKKWEQALASKIQNEPTWFDKVKGEFFLHWKRILPFVTKQRPIGCMEDLQQDYENWKNFWPYMSVMMLLPDISSVPENIRSEAFRIRAETQQYSDVGEQIFIEFFQRALPQFAELVWVLKPAEVYALLKGRLNGVHIESVRARLKGWGLLDGELLSIEELNVRLSEKGLAQRCDRYQIGVNA